MKSGFYLILVILIACSTTADGTIRYVTPAGAGSKDGSTWANAFAGTSLQAAISGSVAGDQVWVACGVYKTTTGTDRNISFSMKNGVEIYGGLQGTETSLSQRVFQCGPCSTLSAEIGTAGTADNSYDVVSNTNLNNTAVIDGFIIRDGNDNRPATSANGGLGGGIYNASNGNVCSPTIRNCVITNNSAVYGGGIFNNGAYGGTSNPIIMNCIITNNTATDGGGGIDNFGLGGNASPTITNCIVYGNTALTAGGMYCWGGNAGGNSNPVILNSAFVKNTATAGNAGGIIADNSNTGVAGNSGTSNPTIKNSVFWGNTASGLGPQFFLKGTGTVSATYSIVDITGQTGAQSLSGPGTQNFSVDPLFVNINNAIGADNCWLTADDGLRFQAISPGINVGSNTGLASVDITGGARLVGPNVDMGPYESTSVTTALQDERVSGFRAFPNPFSDRLYIFSEVPGSVRMFNALGQALRTFNTEVGTTEVDGRELASGIYYLKSNGSVKRLVKE